MAKRPSARQQRVGGTSTSVRTSDGIQNFMARSGLGTNNLSSGSSYVNNYTSRNRVQMEAMYRSSWIVGQAVDVVAEDMTRAGIDIISELEPDDLDKINREMTRLSVLSKLCDTIKWARLYGGAIAVMLIDGQRLDTPLNLDTVAKGSFKGLFVLDRWMVQPSFNELVTEYGDDIGMPKFYDVYADAMGLANQRIHYSRIVRVDGVDLPYWQKISENLWGQSVVERLYDRLVAYDSATQGASQLMFKAHLRTYKVEGLRNLIATGGVALEGLLKQMDMVRQFQSNEGLTLIDMKDDFATHQYAFAGISDLIEQFGEQLSGALQIPLVRLFGQAPKGLNATGDGDIRNYYDGIHSQQERRLRNPLTTVLNIVCRSVLGIEPPEAFDFNFTSLWQLSDTEKTDIAQKATATIIQAEEAGIVSRAIALKELNQLGKSTGIWSNITDDDIADAENDPPADGEADVNEGTNDAGFNKGDHPRADNGQFGSGGGTKGEVGKETASKANITLKGDELGAWTDIRDLRAKAKAYAKIFNNREFVNEDTGSSIKAANSGIRHTIASAQDTLLGTIPAIPDIIKKSKLVDSQPDKDGNVNVMRVEEYQTKISINQKDYDVRMIVKVFKDGSSYYDHSFMV